MDVAKKILYGAACLVITVALIYIGFGLYERSKRLSDAVAKEQDAQLKAITEHNITMYDGCEIAGSLVVGYVKSLVSTYGVTAEITNESLTFSVSDSILFTALRDVDSAYYINPFKLYLCSVVRDVNDVIVKVKIELVS